MNGFAKGGHKAVYLFIRTRCDW